ncbi:MAG: hypothetical protein K2L23_06945 [Odoribacter sp.]|nr:hypothetical protein [Odoribacter sp.]
MNENKTTEKQLSYLKLAYEVQKIANPYVDQGGLSLSYIYLNYVVEKVPVCMNTFRKMMKEDVSDLPELIKAYKEKITIRYLEQLHRQSQKRAGRSPQKMTKKE